MTKISKQRTNSIVFGTLLRPCYVEKKSIKEGWMFPPKQLHAQGRLIWSLIRLIDRLIVISLWPQLKSPLFFSNFGKIVSNHWFYFQFSSFEWLNIKILMILTISQWGSMISNLAVNSSYRSDSEKCAFDRFQRKNVKSWVFLLETWQIYLFLNSLPSAMLFRCSFASL